MDETATNALDLITALRQAKTEVAEAATIAQAASLGANAAVDSAGSLAQHTQAIDAMLDFIRSEERRVGQECKCWCRSRWAPYQYKKKTKIAPSSHQQNKIH